MGGVSGAASLDRSIISEKVVFGRTAAGYGSGISTVVLANTPGGVYTLILSVLG